MILLNGEKINITVFPDKTSQVWKINKALTNKIEFIFHEEGEVFHLAQLCMLLRSVSAQYSLYMPYLPYARQDKNISNETTFALQTFAKIINSLDCISVTALDGHSVIAEEIINNFTSLYPEKQIALAVENTNADCVAFPDKGAEARYTNPIVKNKPILGFKKRDPETGWITDYFIQGNPEGKTILIIDDICDGGMTFKLMAEAMLKLNAKKVHLYTTHGIYSKGIKTLRDSGISRIFDKIGESI